MRDIQVYVLQPIANTCYHRVEWWVEFQIAHGNIATELLADELL
jgi:hypothetical protein